MKHARVQTLAPMPLGLQDRQGQPGHASFTPIIRSWVINAYWKDLQPVQDGPLVTDVLSAGSPATATLDIQMAAARTAGANIRLRFFGGTHAPAWAKSIGGAPMTWSGENSTDTVGRWWTSAYIEACRKMNMLLAAKYDDDPNLAEITLWNPMTDFAEPMLRQTANADNRAALIAAGYTKALDVACFYEAFNHHDRYWARTRTTLACNPLQWVEADGTRGTEDVAQTHTFMQDFRNQLKNRAVLGNNSLRYMDISPVQVSGEPYTTESTGGNYNTMYGQMAAIGPPIYFQTATAVKIGSVIGTLENALFYGASSLELNSAYDDDLTGVAPAALTTAEATSYDASFRAKARWVG